MNARPPVVRPKTMHLALRGAALRTLCGLDARAPVVLIVGERARSTCPVCLRRADPDPLFPAIPATGSRPRGNA